MGRETRSGGDTRSWPNLPPTQTLRAGKTPIAHDAARMLSGGGAPPSIKRVAFLCLLNARKQRNKAMFIVFDKRELKHVWVGNRGRRVL